MTINAGKWFDANWAREKGLYTEVFDSTDDMDTEIQKLATTLSQSNPEAMKELKKVMWSGSDSWDTANGKSRTKWKASSFRIY